MCEIHNGKLSATEAKKNIGSADRKTYPILFRLRIRDESGATEGTFTENHASWH